LLLVVGGEEGQRGGDKIHQAAGLLDVGGNGAELVGERLRLGDNLLELPITLRTSASTPERRRLGVFQGLDFGHHERLGLV
jgi:hypothetical protein